MTQNNQIRQALKQLESAVSILQKLLPNPLAAPAKQGSVATTDETCLECKKPIGTNGRRHLCNGCYHAAMRMLKYTSTTEDELIAANRIAPRSKPGRKAIRNYSTLPSVAKTQDLQDETAKFPESSAAAKRPRGKK